ncbi:ALPHA-MANNOSIDASE domain protein [Mycobacterium xenopi 4042]|uniref:ALPHA-MANNOSIDASE domain protein n=1 Tax=Mycobacterium xenopi 4042 TaxID=1299334 RepID=X8EES5_MYCXE|nr:ALPHA-MANNOSIDASE domain protein [Mycobacterium xenopi 4042]
MNPIYTGKDVSFIDTKQANRAAETTVLDAEKFAVFAGLLAARTTRRPRWPRRGCSWLTAPTTTPSPARSPTRSTSTCSPAGATRGNSAGQYETTRWRCCHRRSAAMS